MKKNITLLVVAVLGLCTPIIQSGCQSHSVTLEPGGTYTEPTLAVSDQAILDASHSIQGFLAWYAANEVFLAKYPEIGALATNVAAHEKEWIRDAYVARDAYADDLVIYRAAIAAGKSASPPSSATMDAALAVLNNVTKQYLAYKTAHPNG